jgi:Family of unknown function (DUF6282)
VPVLSYDLHVHPGPSKAPRWGTGEEVQKAAEESGVGGFVWKAHEQHTPRLCAALPPSPVRTFASASLNPWSTLADVVEALDDGAAWLWGPTISPKGETTWELALPEYWNELTDELRRRGSRRILATGHLGGPGRAQFAELAASSPYLLCSVTHTLYVPPSELRELAARGAVFEIDAYTLRHDLPGRTRHRPEDALGALRGAGALVYFTSDGGQASTGNPFAFGAESLDELGTLIGDAVAEELGVDGPAAVVAWLDGKEGS